MSRVNVPLTAHMNFFKRATTSIVRRPGKTIILLLLVFILGTVIAGAISVEGAISNTDANLRRNMQPIVSVSFDWQAREESLDLDSIDWDDPTTHPPTPELLTASHVRALGELPYVNFYDYTIRTGLQSFELERYTGGEEWFTEEGMPQWFNLRGTSNTQLMQVEQGVINLVQGRTFEEGETVPGGDTAAVIISEALAEANNLNIGDSFELYDFIFVPQDPEDGVTHQMWGAHMFTEENIYAQIGMEFVVIGMYDVPVDPDQDPNNDWQRIDNLNNMYVQNWVLEDVGRRIGAAHESSWDSVDFENPFPTTSTDEENEIEVTPIFILEDPAYIDDFKEAAQSLLPEFHRFEDLSSAFDDIAAPMESLQTIATWILIASVVATLLILSLVITLFLRDRRYEMGVYLALGEKKGRIISQILMEVVVTALVGITLAVFTGNLISNVVSQNMLRNQLVAQQTSQNNDMWGGGTIIHQHSIFDEIGIPTTSMTPDEMMEAFEVSITLEAIGLFYVVGLSVVVLSAVIPVLYVVTLKPKKVLM